MIEGIWWYGGMNDYQILNDCKEGIMMNEGTNEYWMTVKEGIMMNEGRNEYLPNTEWL